MFVLLPVDILGRLLKVFTYLHEVTIFTQNCLVYINPDGGSGSTRYRLVMGHA